MALTDFFVAIGQRQPSTLVGRRCLQHDLKDLSRIAVSLLGMQLKAGGVEDFDSVLLGPTPLCSDERVHGVYLPMLLTTDFVPSSSFERRLVVS